MNNWKNWLLTLVLGGYIVLFSYLLITGNVSKYINPRLSFLLVIALILLAGMLFFNIRKLFRKTGTKQCGCGHHHHAEIPETGSIILLLPVILAFMVSPHILSYQTQDIGKNGGRPYQPSNVAGTPPVSGTDATSPDAVSSYDSLEYKEYTQSAIGNMIFMNDESGIEQLLNSKIALQGKVLHWHKLKANEVIVYRILINCCVADGLPLGILVKLPGNMNFRDGDWIRVEGAIELRPFTDEIKQIEPVAVTVPLSTQYPYFSAINAYKIQIPEEPYLFP